LGETCWADIQS